MKPIALLLALLCLAAPAVAQTVGPIVQTLPGQRNADPSASSTIAVTNTFQQVFAANTNRTGCTIQNNGTHTMWVYFVPNPAGAAATAGASAVLAAGQALNCTVFGMNLTNAVQITGTATDAFYAASW